jgi:hypothetical protein
MLSERIRERLGLSMKSLILSLVASMFLTGCADGTSATTEEYLISACDGVKNYAESLDPSIRQIEIDKARSFFRKAALESSELRYEIFAEYSSESTRYFKQLEAFCKSL